MRARAAAGSGLKLGLKVAAPLAAALIGLALMPRLAAAADVAIAPDATPLPRLAQGYEYDDGHYGYYRPACPEHYFYTCRHDSVGAPHCACWPDAGLYLFGPY
jgi:hypothetical protein